MQFVSVHPCLGAQTRKGNRRCRIGFNLPAYLAQFGALCWSDANGRVNVRLCILPVMKKHSQQIQRESSHGKVMPSRAKAYVEQATCLVQRRPGGRKMPHSRLASSPG